MTQERTRIGRFTDIATRQIVYQTSDALEIDEIDQFEVARRRVYFDDILLVTIHSRVGIAFVVTMAIFFLLLIAIAAVFQSNHLNTPAMWFAGASAPFLLALFTRVLLKQDVITVYGRRSKAAMRFTFRKAYARAKFAEICSLARRTQDRIAAEKAALEPPPVAMADVPMPPVEETGAALEPPPVQITDVPMPPAEGPGTEIEPPAEPPPPQAEAETVATGVSPEAGAEPKAEA
jgi:hypothetical protein